MSKLVSYLVATMTIGAAVVVQETRANRAAATLPAVTPLVNAHSHNDYAHARPLLDALDHGFCSIEADIFLVDGVLLVGHAAGELKPDRTLESLYLKPLAQRASENGGRIYRDGPVITLLIDFKTRPEQTYPALKALLVKYAEILTSVENGKVTQRAVTVICSGYSPRQELAAEATRYAALDGRLADLQSTAPAHLIPLISENWKSLFKWRGGGPMPDDQRKKLLDIVTRAHEAGRRVRFWASPDSPEVWAQQRAAGVDLLSVDDHAALRKFLSRP